MEHTKEHILVTGGTGFVGKALIDALGSESLIRVISRNKKEIHPFVEVCIGDLEDGDFCTQSLIGIDTVFYLAGYKKNIAYHTQYPSDFIFGNVNPLMTFLNAAKSSSVKKIVYVSSSNVGLYREGEKDGYVVGKYINELILDAFARQYGVDIHIMRSVGVYGPGDNFDPQTANVIPAMIEKVYKAEGSVEVWGTGSRSMQFVYIDDLVKNIIAAKESTKKFSIVGHQQVLTIKEIVEKIIKLSGKEVVVTYDSSKPDKPSTLFELDTIIEPYITFDEGLCRTIEFYTQLKKI